jgi:hypothetical protein
MRAYVASIVALPGGSSADSGVPLAARRPATRASGAACVWSDDGDGARGVCERTPRRDRSEEKPPSPLFYCFQLTRRALRILVDNTKKELKKGGSEGSNTTTGPLLCYGAARPDRD